jgi:hypothetical protein
LFTKAALVFGRQIAFTLLRLTIHQEFVFLFDLYVITHHTPTLLDEFIVLNSSALVAAVFDTNTLYHGTLAGMNAVTL